MSKQRKVIDVRERFFEKVDTGNTPDGCWLWKAGKSKDGYGRFYYDGRDQRAHRVSYELAYGPIGPNLLACHICDNPSCVNSSHIFIGTHQQNMADCKRKRRNATNVGEANPRARLKTAQVLRIRELHAKGLRTRHQLVAMYKVDINTIDAVIYRKNWKHL